MFERIAKRENADWLAADGSVDVISGLGNIYRAELLFRARVSPFRPGSEVPVKVLQEIWKDAVPLMRAGDGGPQDRHDAAKGSAASAWRGAQGRRRTMSTGARDGLAGCAGRKRLTKVFGGRNLFWCPQCQAH